eukprot:122732_1
MFGWIHCKVRNMLNELNIGLLNDYDVTVPRCGSRTMAVQITESARKASEAEKKNNKNNKNNKDNKNDINIGMYMGMNIGLGMSMGMMGIKNGRNQRITHGKGFTTDGIFLYVHCSRGLIKIGTGELNTRKWEFYACKNYRNNENVQIVCISNKLYARSSQMKFGIIEVINCNNLEFLYSIYLGIDCNKSVPTQWKSKDLPIVTDGIYLYLVSYEYDYNQYYKKINQYKKEKEKEIETERQLQDKKKTFKQKKK